MAIEPTASAEVANRVAVAFAAFPRVVAVAMAGSGISGDADERSDIDLYVYAEEPLALADRAAVATNFATRPVTPVVVTHVNALLNSLDDLLANEGLIRVARNADY